MIAFLTMGLVGMGYWVMWAGANQASLYDAWRCQIPSKPKGSTGASTSCAPQPGDIKLAGGTFIWRPQDPSLPAPQIPGFLQNPITGGRGLDTINKWLRDRTKDINKATAGANGVLVGPCIPGLGGGPGLPAASSSWSGRTGYVPFVPAGRGGGALSREAAGFGPRPVWWVQ